MFRGLARRSLSVLFAVAFLAPPSWAQAVFDGSTGGQVAGSTAGPTIDISQSTVVGGNAFNSFGSFSVPGGQTLTFTDVAASGSIQNIINRVTGTDITHIDGTLASTVAGANFYLINPNGIMMGSGSSIDVPASIHLTTANELRFADSTALQATVGGSTFTAAAPASFGFTGVPVGDITIAEGQIIGKPGANVSLVGGNITLQDGLVSGVTTRIEATSGRITLVGVEGPADIAVPDGSAFPDLKGLVLGNVSVLGGAVTGSERIHIGTASSHASQPADIFLGGNNVAISNSSIDHSSVQSRWSNIVISANGDLSIENGATILSVSSQPDSGNGEVRIAGANVTIDQSLIATNASVRPTSGGDVVVDAAGVLSIQGEISDSIRADLRAGILAPETGFPLLFAAIATNSNSYQGIGLFEDWGKVTLRGTQLAIGANIFTSGTLSLSAANGTEVSGSVQASSIFDSRGGIQIRTGELTTTNAVFSNGWGDFSVDANNLSASNSVFAGSIANRNVRFVVGGRMSLAQNSIFQSLTIGSASITTGVMVIDNSVVSLKSISTGGPHIKPELTITARNIDIVNGGMISADLYYPGFPTAVAPQIEINADAITLRGASSTRSSQISADTQTDVSSVGSAGSIDIHAATLSLLSGAYLSSVSYGAGNAGTIVVCCSSTIIVDGAGSQIRAGSAAGSTGAGGKVFLSSDELALQDGGRITVATEGAGAAGEINIRTGAFSAIDLSRQAGSSDAVATGIATVSGASGAPGAGGGRIAIEAGTFLLRDGAVVTTNTAGTSPAGQIDIRASEFVVSGVNAKLLSQATGSSGGNAGDISIGAYNITFKDGATLSTFSQSGAGGNIKMDWNSVTTITGSTISTEVKSGNLSSGNIFFATSPLPDLGFEDDFLAFCKQLLDIYKGRPKYDPTSTDTKTIVFGPGTNVTCENQGGGVSCRPPTPPGVTCVGAPCNRINTGSATYPPNPNTRFTVFTPPPVIVVPERNVTVRCGSRGSRSALSNSYSGSGAVGGDPSALMPAVGGKTQTAQGASAHACAG